MKFLAKKLFPRLGFGLLFQAYLCCIELWALSLTFTDVPCFQVSTLHQLENITSYPFMGRLVDSGLVRLHAMWFDIYTGSIFYFNKPHKTFIEITEENWDDFLNEKDREALKKQQIFGLRNLVI